jgi:hypothetical protein
MDPSESEPGPYAKPLREPVKFFVWTGSVVDPRHFDANTDALCGSVFLFDAIRIPTFRSDAYPDPDPSFEIKSQTLETLLK